MEGEWDRNTHHCSNFSPSAVVDEGEHKRRQEEEEGANSRVNQVLQGMTPETPNFNFQTFFSLFFKCMV